MMTGKALQVEKRSLEVEGDIDRIHGVPTIQATMSDDRGVEQLGHLNVSMFCRGRMSPSSRPGLAGVERG
jgi:hypothetical protein